MKTIMTHLVAGYPTEAESEKMALAMSKNGAGFLEIQIPFSDPIADGPTIFHANQVAIEKGMTTEKALKMIERIRTRIDKKTKIVVMTYANIPYHFGVQKFCEQLKRAGVYGLIVPDLPLAEEKNEHFIKICRQHNIHAIQIVSPITPETRLKAIAKVARGFVYCVSHTGKTGVQDSLDGSTLQYLDRVRKNIPRVPLALGFGISKPGHVKIALKKADIAIMGSVFIKLYERGGLEEIEKFLQEIKEVK